jgi:lysozyme
MQISYKGLSFLKDQEGFKDTAYKDSGGVWTIGYGTIRVDGKPVVQGMTCTEPQAAAWMESHLASVQTAINQAVRTQLTQHQFDALCSFVYNEGEGAFRSSTLLGKINVNDFIGAGKQFDRWVYVGKNVIPGLIARRRRERDVFEGHPSS